MQSTLSLNRFCIDRRLEPRQILRIVKPRVLSAVQDADGRDDPTWSVDLSREIGLMAEKQTKRGQIRYRVTQPERLYKWIARQLGFDLASEHQARRIAEAAQLYYEAATDADERYYLVDAGTGKRFNPNPDWFGELKAALSRIAYEVG